MGLGLPHQLVAALAGLFALALAFWLSRPIEFDEILKRQAMVYFGVMAVAVPMLNNPLLIMLLALVLTMIMRPPPRYLIACFLCLVFFVPDSLRYRIPFPGINFLIDLQLWMVVAWLYLLPLLLRRDAQRKDFTAVDVFYLTFVILTVLLDFRDVTVTEGLRRSVTTLSFLALPYFAISRNMQSSEDIKMVWQALLLTTLILGCVGFFVQLLRWDFMMLGGGYSEARYGFIRTGLTMAPGLFGVLCGYSMLVLLRVTRGSRKTFVFTVLLIAVVATGTRSVFLAVPLMFMAALFAKKVTVRALTFGVIALIASSGVILERIQAIDTSTMANPYNIEYRQRLIGSSFDQIKASPAFGDPNFIDSPAFFPVRQAQDFVDITNRYLQIVLQNGLVTLFFFVGAYVFALRAVVAAGAAARCARHDDRDFVLLFAFLIGYLFFIAAFSDTSHVGLVGAVLLGIARGASCRSKRQSKRDRVSCPAETANT